MPLALPATDSLFSFPFFEEAPFFAPEVNDKRASAVKVTYKYDVAAFIAHFIKCTALLGFVHGNALAGKRAYETPPWTKVPKHRLIGLHMEGNSC